MGLINMLYERFSLKVYHDLDIQLADMPKTLLHVPII
jgi:hypothetical protein